ncbi:MAG: thiolase family protein, partial [Candidatus Syntropharchaeales archaeon]
MRDVAVIGVGQTKFGRTERTCIELFGEAAHQAMGDAGVTPKEIEGLWIGNCFAQNYENMINIAPHLAWEIGAKTAPAFRLEGGCTSATYAFILAWNAVASGLYDIVIAGGTERTLIAGTPYATRTFAMGDELYGSSTGNTFPGVFASASTMYARKYGIPLDKLREMMAHVSIKNHKHGSLNPKAQFYQKYGDLKVED